MLAVFFFQQMLHLLGIVLFVLFHLDKFCHSKCEESMRCSMVSTCFMVCYVCVCIAILHMRVFM